MEVGFCGFVVGFDLIERGFEFALIASSFLRCVGVSSDAKHVTNPLAICELFDCISEFIAESIST